MEYDHDEEACTEDQDQDESPSYLAYQSSSSNHTGPMRLIKTDIYPQLWKQLPDSMKQIVIDHNKKLKMIKSKSISHGGKPKPQPTLAKPNPNPQQVHLHEKDDSTPEETLRVILKLWYMNA